MNRDELKLLLLKSLDNQLTTQEQILLNQALEEHNWLQEELESYLLIRNQMANFSIEVDENFHKSILEKVSNRAKTLDQRTVIVRLFPKVVAACILVALAFTANLYFTQGSFDLDSFVGLDNVTPEEAYSYLLYYEQ